MTAARTFVAFAELLQEWAELPSDLAHAPAWGAALAYEMTHGIWRGCNVRVLSSDDSLYPLLVNQHSSATLWRNRTHEIALRAQSFAAHVAPTQSGTAPIGDPLPIGTDIGDLDPGDSGDSDSEPTMRTPTISRDDTGEASIDEPPSTTIAAAALSAASEP